MTEYYKIIVLAKDKEDAARIERMNRRFTNGFAKDFVSVTVIDDEEAPE